MNVMINKMIIEYSLKCMMSNNERVDRLLRLLNTSDGRNVIELL